MNLSELKLDLLKLIVETDDSEALEEIAAHFHALLGKGDWGQEISEKEKMLIQIGLRQLENGEGVPYEAVRAKAQRILQQT